MTDRDLLAETTRLLAVGAAQRNVLAADATGDLDARIATRRSFCAAIESHYQITEGQPIAARPIEMAVNEYATLGNLLATAGDHAAARAAHERAVAIAQETATPDFYVRAVSDLASYLTTRGAYAEALAALMRGRDEAARIEPDPARQVDARIQLTLRLAEVWRWLGDGVRAGQEREEARSLLAAAQERGDAFQRFLLLSRETDLRMEDMLTGIEAGGGPDLDRADTAFRELVPVYQKLNVAAAALPYYAARIAAARSDAAAVLELTAAALPDFMATPQLRPKIGVLRALRARAMLDQGLNVAAVAEATAAVMAEQAHSQQETIWQAHWRLAQAHEANGHVPAALAAYDDAVAAVDGVRRTSLGYRLDNSFLRDRRPLFDAAIALAAQHGDGWRVARYSDAIKSRFLGAALARGAPPPPPQDWVEKLDALGSLIENGLSQPSGSHIGSADVARWRAERLALIERRLWETGAADAGGSTDLDIAATLQSLATRRQAALGLFKTGHAIHATLLFDGAVRLGTVRLPPAINDNIQLYARNATKTMPAKSYFDPAMLDLRVEDLLPPAFVGPLRDASSVIISAHAELNLLPWALLAFGDGRLCETLPVGMMPNLAAIVPMAARRAAEPRIAIIGAPDEAHKPAALRFRFLPGALAGIEALYLAAGGVVAPTATGRDATVATYRKLTALPGADGACLHLASHGRFEPDDPNGSCLEFFGRRLTAAEITTRPLGFAEVTLHACSTGVRPDAVDGVAIVGDDVVGLPASFLEAGAGALLVSTTESDDEAAAAFYLGYHRHRLAGAPPLAALATTQRELIAGGTHKVRDWAGFCLYSCL